LKSGGVWYSENLTETALLQYKIRKLIFSGETPYQKVEVIDTYDYGKCLILDGKLQSSLMDEWVYHEAIVHPALLTHPNPSNILIIGGGEGGILREVLKHNTVSSVVMVDLDKDVIEVSKKYLREICGDSFEDKRVKLIFGDGRSFLTNQPNNTYDVIIIDVTDPLEGGPSYLLYTKEFYTVVNEKLGSEGLMVTQATSIFHSLSCFSRIYKTVSVVFPLTSAYRVEVASYSSPWGFVLGSKKFSPEFLTVDEIDKKLELRGIKDLKFYDGKTHQSIFSLPKHLRKKLEEEEEIVTDDNPTFMVS